MSLLPRAMGQHDPGSIDPAIARLVERAMHRVEPDPLFRRRLRGSIVNQFVAAREGQLRGLHGQRPARRMGTLGRAVLYASVTLAIGVSAVGAAAQDSLPGDALYGVKLRLEEIRLQIAPPSVRDELAAMSLQERVEEIERLVAAGEWSLVPAAAARVADAEAALSADADSAGTTGHAAADQAIDALEAAYAKAPDAARPGLQRALAAAGGDPASARPSRPARGGDSPLREPRGRGAPSAED